MVLGVFQKQAPDKEKEHDRYNERLFIDPRGLSYSLAASSRDTKPVEMEWKRSPVY
jgi:hypothetical protein